MPPWLVTEAPFTCGGTGPTLTFLRASADQNSAGELVLSFASALTLAVDLQPEGGGYPRYLHGTLVEVNYTAVAFGHPDVRVADRVMISNAPLEVVNVLYYGLEQTEIQLRYVR